MLKLQPMTEAEFDTYKAWEIEDYAAEIARSFRLPQDEARAAAIRDIDGALGQGLASPNQLLYNLVLDAEDGEKRLGYLWIDVDSQKKRCYIYDIYLHPEFRGQGWGRKTLELLETMLKEQGIARISLNVFAHNSTAQALYRKMGFEVTNMRMQKWLGD